MIINCHNRQLIWLQMRRIRFIFSIASIWEVEIKNSLGKIAITGEELAEYCKEAGFELLQIREAHIFKLKTLKREKNAPKHNDPFDRIMLAQSKEDDCKFITHDSLVPFYNEKTGSLI